MKRTYLHVFLVALVFASLYVRSEAAPTMFAADVTACLSIADAIPALKALINQPWTQANLEACNAFAITCAPTGSPDVVRVSKLLINTITLTGTFPEAIGSLTSLMNLQLSAKLTGTLPASWGALNALDEMFIGGSAVISGSIPSAWSGLYRVTSMTLKFAPGDAFTLPDVFGTISSVSITGAVLSAFPTSYASIRELTLANVAIASGSIPDAFFQRDNLLTFSWTATGSADFGVGTVLPSFAAATKLTALALSQVGIGGSIPTDFPTTLQGLTLTSLPNIQGTIPQYLMDMPNLIKINFNYLGSVTGDIPGPTTPSSCALMSASFNYMGLTGTISPKIINSAKLSYFSARGSASLVGGLPELDNPASSKIAQILIQESPLIGGSIPSTWAMVPSLYYLALDNTGLTGSIPQTYADNVTSTAFNFLSLSSNNLTGTVPSIVFPTNLPTIALTNCGLTGTIPLSFTPQTWAGMMLSGNLFDQCANTGNSQQQALKIDLIESYNCNLEPTAGRSDCGCLGTWPDNCFTTACAPVSPPTAAPVAGPVAPSAIPLPPAYNPSMGPISIPNYVPIGSASSASLSFALFVVATLAIFYAL